MNAHRIPPTPTHRTMRRRAVAGCLVALVALAGCGGDDDDGDAGDDVSAATASPAAGATAEIVIADFSFGSSLTVAVGTTVTVTNEDSASHTWTSNDDLFDSGTMAGGDSFEFTFDEAGRYTFFCAIHPSMTGVITVEG